MPSNGNQPSKVVQDQYARERVVTADLAGVLLRWLEMYETERPVDAQTPVWANGERSFEGALQQLCRITELAPRRIWGIVNNENKTTSYWLADRILTAIERSHCLQTDEIRILEDFSVHNTRGMSNEDWFAYLERRGDCV